MLADVITILLAMSKNTPPKEACKNPMVHPPTRLDIKELKWFLKTWRNCHWLHVDINSMRKLQSWENFCRFLSGSSAIAMNAATGFVALSRLLMAKVYSFQDSQLDPPKDKIRAGACWLSC